MNRLISALVLIALVIMLAGCGSSGGNDDSPDIPAAETPRTNWGSMRWNQDNWS